MPACLSSVRVTFVAVFVFFAAIGCRAQGRVEFTDDPMPGVLEDGWLTFRVVDDFTGKPVVDAEVYLTAETLTPIAGEFWHTRKSRSDVEGVVHIPVADIKGKWNIQVLRHPDYGICTRGDRENDIWRVGRAFDVPVLVLDWQGRPAPGAMIGFCGYCGHSPDLVNAVTGPDGIATLPGIDPHNHIRDVYVQKPGLGLGYDDVEWYPGGPPDIVRCAWSQRLTGRVVDHLGEPVAGAFVAARDVHRGPWGRTAADGTFTILGGDPAIGATHVRTAEGREIYFETPGRYPVTLKLPDLTDPKAHQGTIDVPEWQTPEVATKKVRVRFETSGEALTVAVRRPGLPLLESEGDIIEVPVKGPFAITFSPEEAERGLPGERSYGYADASELPPGPIVLKWFAPTRVTGRAVDEDGNPVAIESQWLEGWKKAKGDAIEEHPDGRFEYRVRRSGLAVLRLQPLNDELRMRSVWVSLPMRGDDRHVDLGDLVLSKTPQLIVGTDADPQPFADVEWSRAGFQRAGRERGFQLGYDGDWQGPDLQEGDVISLPQKGGQMAWRAQLKGAPPWQIAPPKGQLDLVVTARDGKAIVPLVTFADQEFRMKDGGELRRMPTGPLRLRVGAAGYRTAVVDLVVTTEPQQLVLELPPR